MQASDKTPEPLGSDESRIRAILGCTAYLRAATGEIARSYGEKITQAKIAEHFGIGGKKPQARISDWFRLGKPPAEVIQQPKKMLKLLDIIELDTQSLWNAVTAALPQFCVNPDCPTLLFYVVGDEVFARPSVNDGSGDRICCWCRKGLKSICRECDRPIANGSSCQCGVAYVSGLPNSLDGLAGNRLRLECDKLNAFNANICGEPTVVGPWRAG